MWTALSSFDGLFHVLRDWSRPRIARRVTFVLGPDEVRRTAWRDPVVVVTVQSGVVWLTSTPADGDLIVRAGECIRLDTPGMLVLQACVQPHESARVTIGAAGTGR